MRKIELITNIQASIQEVFDVSRSIDFHIQSASQTYEKAIAGRTSGLIKLGETVTWKGKHFGLYLTHQSKITKLDAPDYFVDEMISGHFKSFKHQHIFKEKPEGTLMIDVLEYSVPYGWLGKLFDQYFLKKHLTDFLNSRNTMIKFKLENK